VGDASEREELGDPTWVLEELVRDLDAPHAFLKLFVEVEGGVDMRARINLPPGYFPRAFTVVDACVTNASFIWFAKHFCL
jgi:hypothetical protein